MKINSIKIENFYSFQDQSLDFDKLQGIVLIEGKNKDLNAGSNGAGKSALIESVVWGLFGRTIRKSTEEAVVNFQTKKGCKVTIKINGEATIIRQKRPTFLEFFVGEENRTKESITETQLEIEKYLNTNYKTFLASMMFGQNNELDFISATPEEKRTIIKNFLNLEEIFQLRDKIKDLKSKFGGQKRELDSNIALVSKDCQQLEFKLSTIDKTIVDNGLDIEDLRVKELAWKKVSERRDDASYNLQSVENQMREIGEVINKGEYVNEDKCPTCGIGTMTKTVTARDIIMAEAKYGELCVERNKLLEMLKECEGYQQETTNKPEISSKKLEEKLALIGSKSVYESELEQKKTQLAEFDKARKDIAKTIEILIFWETAFSEQGIMQYVIKNILQFFNEKCAYYLSHLTNGQYTLEFNEKLEESISINKNKTNYFSLSGGEKTKINLSVLLALQSLLALTDKETSNLVFFDEIAKECDPESLQGIYTLLQKLKKDKTLFIITHNNDLKALMENVKIIKVVKHNGVSTIRL